MDRPSSEVISNDGSHSTATGSTTTATTMPVLSPTNVPATNAAVAQIFGVAHLSMLSGFVFLSHQVGSFLGVWLGGVLYDRNGNYDTAWLIAIALGIFAALINLPVKEDAIRRGTLPGAGTLNQA